MIICQKLGEVCVNSLLGRGGVFGNNPKEDCTTHIQRKGSGKEMLCIEMIGWLWWFDGTCSFQGPVCLIDFWPLIYFPPASLLYLPSDCNNSTTLVVLWSSRELVHLLTASFRETKKRNGIFPLHSLQPFPLNSASTNGLRSKLSNSTKKNDMAGVLSN